MDSHIYFKSCEDYTTENVDVAIESLFSMLPICETLGTHSKVLVKPNLLSKMSPDKAVTTHPEVVRACIRALHRRNVPKSQIIVADSAGGLYNSKQTKALYQGCGLTKVVEEEGAVLYTDCEWETVTCSGQVAHEFTLIKPALESNFILNLPKFKTHVMTGMTAGVKNMFGCIPGLDKSQWHTRFPEREPFGHMLLDLYQRLTPHMSLIDGILAMEGDGPGGGTPRPLGILMASEDTIGQDLAVATMMGLSPTVVPYLKVGRERNLCESTLSLDLIGGDTHLYRPIPQWILPKSYQNGQVGSTSFVAMLPKPLQKIGKSIESALAPRPVVLTKACISCKRCSEICSKNAIVFPDEKAFIEKKKCILCFCCHEVCPVKAIDVKKSPLSSSH